jgi:hypothetical protein
MRSRHLLTIVASLAMTSAAWAAPDAPDAPTPAPAQDGGGAAAPAEKPPIQPPRSIYDKAFDKAMNGWMEDPLKHIEGDMSHAFGGLTEFKTDRPVQDPQARAVTRLDAVIKLLEKQCKGGSGGGGGSKPLQDSVIAKRATGMGEMHDPKAGDKQWASLPPKQREQILQSRTEGFPPGFEAILQSYYERLAQEQAGDAGAAAVPTPTPAGGAKE